MTITLKGIAKSYGGSEFAVRGLDLVVPTGAFMCLLGPSGCGKTTTLRMIAGLEQPSYGEIDVDGQVLDSVGRGLYVPPERRAMGLVFQNYALWPHLTVRANTEFGLRMRKVAGAERRQRAEEALDLVQVGDCIDRYPSQLSGGQQQRVALARMLAVNPRVLLLDEPLSNLDARLRLEMRAELKRIHDATGATIVFVTHDQLEAMTMATHVAVMHKGVLQQVAAPMEMYDRPANVFVAGFVGSPPMNLPPERSELTASLLSFAGNPPGGSTVGVRPESIGLREPPPDTWQAPAVVEAVLPTGASSTIQLRLLDTKVFAISSAEDDKLRPRQTVDCWIRRERLRVFDGDGIAI